MIWWNSPGRPPAAAPRQRLIVLGASNLARGISTLIDVAHRQWGAPLEVYAALGHGRSYGRTSNLLGRSLPGIVPSRIWPALAAAARDIPSAALLTDIGNDLFYDLPCDEIAAWVQTCLTRLRALDAALAMSMMPLANLERVTPHEFYLVRKILFPRGKISFEIFSERARRLDAILRALAAAHGATLVEQRRAWYGLDPIHHRRRARQEVWQTLLAPLRGVSADFENCETLVNPRVNRAWSQWIYLRSLVPAERHWFGIAQRRAQPAGRLRAGTTIALY